MDFTWLSRGAATGEPGKVNQNEFYPTKRFITDRNNPQFHHLSGWLVSDDLAGEEAGCGGTGLVTCGLWLWGQLYVLPNSLKRHWRWLMVEKLTLNDLATALVDIPAACMQIACSLKTKDICGIVLWNKTTHFKVSFNCLQHKVHLCNNDAV
jgi:hypothetical protein